MQYCTSCDKPIYDWSEVDGCGRCSKCEASEENNDIITNEMENMGGDNMEKTMINLVNVLKTVGYSATAVKGQKTRLVKIALGLEGDAAKETFMYDKAEVLAVLDTIMKSKSDKADKATEAFDKVSAEKFEAEWLEEYVEVKAEATPTKKASAKKGTLADYKEFAIETGLRAEFEKFMVAKYGAGTVVAPWEIAE